MREVIARALYDRRVVCEREGREAFREAFGDRVGCGVIPWEAARELHLLEADAVVGAICENIGWPEINAYRAELAKGQDIHEDGGGYFARSIGALLGRTSDPVESYRQAAKRLLTENDNKSAE